MHGYQETSENHIGPCTDGQEQKESGQHSLKNHFDTNNKKNPTEAASKKANQGASQPIKPYIDSKQKTMCLNDLISSNIR